MTDNPQLPPRVERPCHRGHVICTRQPEGARLPCVRCHVEHGETVLVTLPADAGNRPTIRAPLRHARHADTA
jgi:hypothetical protein